ncbi:hypothetical protein [Xanthomonas sp. CFBP 8445]|uniref:hypothetical protein n=1 Tax=Xanthomonas sp. CFBP 8445 TaxID=2971236 RepID=UPI0021DF846F|nr:hypothetical protein [Xanthomonas sp. CFBP 8445]UYC10268.1 hypothetical protein NUG21_10630 [Xanthomonas sp. CFBP 8445]
MIKRKALVFMALALAAGSSQAWTLVYATDANGNVSAGSLQSLRTAVDNGADLKVLVTAPNQNTQHTWGVLCTNTSMKLDSSQALVCVGHDDYAINIGMGSQFGEPSNPPFSAHFLINTSGEYAEAYMRLGSGELISKSKYVYAMRWFVN